MDRRIAEANIEHYQRLLAAETDHAKRETIARLLAVEEAKLRADLDAERVRNGLPPLGGPSQVPDLLAPLPSVPASPPPAP